MNESNLHHEPVEQLDDRLYDLIEVYSDRKAKGEDVSVDAFVAQYPELTEELKRYLPAVAALAEMNVSTAGSSRIISAKNDLPTDRVLGDFRIHHEIGRGGMGVVYEAEQISLTRKVALKVLPFAAVLDHKQITRFKNEARAAGSLDHPNIVPVHAVGEERGVYYYAMALVEGQSLAEVIAEMRLQEKPTNPNSDGFANPIGERPHNSQAPAAETQTILKAAISTQRSSRSSEYFRTVATLGIQAAEALQFACENGVLHRDIKPANLLLDTKGKLWVTDFGLARLEADAGMTMTGDLLGTLRYMSPEQALGNRVVLDQRTDIYSLGITLYELVALRAPFDAKDRQELLKQIAFEEAPRLRKLNLDIPSELETVIHKAINKERDDRYQTAQELADDLRRYLEDKPILARRTSVAKQISKWSKRHSGMLSLAIVALATFTIILSIAVVLIRSSERRAVNEKAAAEDDFQLASASLSEFLAFLEDSNKEDASFPKQRVLLKSASNFLDKLLDRHRDDDNLLYQLAQGYYQVGLIQTGVGSDAESLRAYEKSRQIFLELISRAPSNESYRIEAMRLLNNLAHVNRRQYRPEAGKNFRIEALELMESGISNDSTDWFRMWHARCISLCARQQPDVKKRKQMIERSIRILDGMHTDLHESDESKAGIGYLLADARRDLAERLRSIGKTAEAEKEILLALHLYEDATRANPPPRHSFGRTAVTHIALGKLYNSLEEFSRARIHLERAKGIISNQTRNIRVGRINLYHHINLHTELGKSARGLNQPNVAADYFSKVWAHRVAVFESDNDNPKLSSEYANATIGRARTFFEAGEFQEALSWMLSGVTELERSIELIKLVGPEQRPFDNALDHLARRYVELAGMLEESGDKSNAKLTLEKALKLVKDLAYRYPNNSRFLDSLTKIKQKLADLKTISVDIQSNEIVFANNKQTTLD